jgi:hypothetical protein
LGFQWSFIFNTNGKSGERPLEVFKILGTIALSGMDKFKRDTEDATGNGKKLANAIGKGLEKAAKVGVAAVTAASAAVGVLLKNSLDSYAEFEQLVGGAAKIFDEMSQTKILEDANNAYKELGLSASEYLAVINDVGATFAATMGDEAGYEAAKIGLKAISDYASGTGKNVNELSQKFTLITRSTSSYQSIADQFSGILPATSKGFLEQAQAAGILSDKYTELTQVPIDEYQAAVSQMLEQGVAELGLANNTIDEAYSTLSGSLSMTKAAWKNLVTGLADDNADMEMLIGNLVDSASAAGKNIAPKVTQILNGISSLITKMAPVIANAIPVIITQVLPGMIQAGIQMIQSLLQGIQNNVGELATGAITIISMLAESLCDLLPTIIAVGLELIVALALGLAENLPELIPTIIQMIGTIVDTILANLDLFILAGIQLVVG